MKKCNSCNIEFNIESNICPLCQNELIGNNSEVTFPKNVWLKTNSLILKIILFITLVTIILIGFITKNIKITLIVSLGLFSNYVIVYFILKNYKNIYRMLGKYGLLIIVLLILWYILTKSKIITNYIIPSVCLLELLINLIIGIILRKNYLVKYSEQILLNIMLLFVPTLLVKLNLTTNNILAHICTICSIITILYFLIFFFEDIKYELKKIFNL